MGILRIMQRGVDGIQLSRQIVKSLRKLSNFAVERLACGIPRFTQLGQPLIALNHRGS